MANRATTSFFRMAFLWGAIAVLQLLIYNFRYPLPLHVAGGLIVTSVVLGLGFGKIFAGRRLADLEKKGESRVPWGIVLVLIGAVFVFGAFLYLFASQVPNATFTAIFDFLFPSSPAFLAAEAFLFRHWERNHEKHVFQTLWSGRLYADPYP